MTLEISAAEVKRRLDAGEKLHLIDVREPHEFAIAKIANSELIPMRQIPGELQSLEAKADSAPLVVYCHHGVRSMMAIGGLRMMGFKKLHNLSGGIDAWSVKVDATVPRY